MIVTTKRTSKSIHIRNHLPGLYTKIALLRLEAFSMSLENDRPINLKF